MAGGGSRVGRSDHNKRRRAEQRGHLAERVSGLLLRLKGYKILSRRFRCAAGEIDLIARRANHIAFVEVKARASRGAALDSVTTAQRRRIVRSAEVWLGRAGLSGGLPADYSVSFDLILVTPKQWPKHLQAAFDATM